MKSMTNTANVENAGSINNPPGCLWLFVVVCLFCLFVCLFCLFVCLVGWLVVWLLLLTTHYLDIDAKSRGYGYI